MVRWRRLWLFFWNFRYLPVQQRLAAIRLRRRVLPRLGTRWKLRYSRRAASHLQHPPVAWPTLFVLRLLWPWPVPGWRDWRLEATLPPPPRAVWADRTRVRSQVRDLMRLRTMPLWELRDTPQRAFYRLYEAFCAGDGHMITYETEYFWRRDEPEWATENIPDPRCVDAEQYAVMASLAEVLVRSFEWRIEIGLRRDGSADGPDDAKPPERIECCPAWTAEVPGLAEELIIDPDDVRYFDSPFHKRNIIASTGHFRTV